MTVTAPTRQIVILDNPVAEPQVPREADPDQNAGRREVVFIDKIADMTYRRRHMRG